MVKRRWRGRSPRRWQPTAPIRLVGKVEAQHLLSLIDDKEDAPELVPVPRGELCQPGGLGRGVAEVECVRVHDVDHQLPPGAPHDEEVRVEGLPFAALLARASREGR